MNIFLILKHAYIGIIRNIESWDRKALKKFSPFASKHRRTLLAEKSDQWGSSSVHCCAIRIGSGRIHSTSWSSSEPSYIGGGDTWAGMGRYQSGETTTIRMLLDDDNGTLSVYQDGRPYVIKTGLTGSYCWVVNLWGMTRAPQEVEMTMGNPPVV